MARNSKGVLSTVKSYLHDAAGVAPILAHRVDPAGGRAFMAYRGTLRPNALKLVAKKLQSWLAAERSCPRTVGGDARRRRRDRSCTRRCSEVIMRVRVRDDVAKSKIVERASKRERPEARNECPRDRRPVPYSRTSQRKVRSSVCPGRCKGTETRGQTSCLLRGFLDDERLKEHCTGVR